LKKFEKNTQKLAQFKKPSYLCIALQEKTLVERFGLVVQLVRMPPCHGGGRGFESRPVRKLEASTEVEAFLFLA
jgi:hypothetical protein